MMSEAKNESSDEGASLERLVNWQWWCERSIPVYEGNWYEWMAPRWYLIVVACAYAIMCCGFIYGMTELATAFAS